MAQALAQARAMGGQQGEPGLESPTGQRILENLAIAASGYGAGNLGAGLAAALAKRGVPAMQALGEAGSIFPEGTPPAELPVIPPGAKTGDAHALHAYFDKLTNRDYYNVFGDPASPGVKNAGWGSSVSAETLKKYGIPIVGKEPPRSFAQPTFK